MRPATIDDLPEIIDLTRAARARLAEWSPVYFRPREGADEGHAAFLSFMVGSDDHDTVVVEGADGEVVAFFVRIPQPHHVWVDDLSVTTVERWPETIDAVVRASPERWITCVSPHDTPRVDALRAADRSVVSSYFARSTEQVDPLPEMAHSVEAGPGRAAPHTFGGVSFAATTPGALVVGTEDGHVIGSPSMSPPIYDPGGPSTVVDQVVGGDRAELIDLALRTAAGRGDAQLIVVSSAADHELDSGLRSAGFREEVQVFG